MHKLIHAKCSTANFKPDQTQGFGTSFNDCLASTLLGQVAIGPQHARQGHFRSEPRDASIQLDNQKRCVSASTSSRAIKDIY
jgi:hypothetical protein